MIPVCRDEFSTRAAGTDFTVRLRLHVEIKFRPGKAGQFSIDIKFFCLSYIVFSCVCSFKIRSGRSQMFFRISFLKVSQYSQEKVRVGASFK